MRHPQSLSETLWRRPDAEALEWLRGRRILPRTIKTYRIGVAQDVWYSRLRRRILFPLYRNGVGEFVGFQGRIMESDPEFGQKGVPKYYHDVQDTSRTLFGMYQAAYAMAEAPGPICVVEGPLDALRLSQNGWPAVAVLKSSLSYPQAALLRCVTDRVVLIGDGDRAGQKGIARSALECSSLGLRMRYVYCPDGQDPNSMPRKALEQMMRETVRVTPDILEIFANMVS